MIASIIGVLKLLRPFLMFVALAVSCFFALINLPLRFIGINLDYFIISTWSKITLWIYGIKIKKLGTTTKESSIITTNHISYWDILTISASYKTFFVSRADVKNWPLLGLGARAVRTVFIEREKAMSAMDVLNNKAVKLLNGNNSLVMFAEGTSSAKPCLPFKNGAFHLSIKTGRPIKPIAIYYDRMDYIPWIDDDFFVPHLLKMAKAPRITCYIYEMPHMYPKDFKSMVEMKQACQKMVQEKIDHIKKDILGEKDNA